MYFMLGLSDVTRFMNNALRGLFGFLCEIIYPLIAQMYTLFKEMGTIVYADGFQELYNKISLIIGIFMVFRITFWLIELLINPDGIKDKEKSPAKIIQKVLISVVLLATTPTIFEYANDLQIKIMNSQIIEKIFSVETMNDTDYVGRYLSAELFMNFYTPNENVKNNTNCQNLTGTSTADGESIIYNELKNAGTMNKLTGECLTEKENNLVKDSEYVINFNGLFATAVGAFVLWMLLMYCIEVGTRFIQLVYLQVIAPVPIMCYLVPGKDNMFTKWIKQCTTTYLDLFIRMVIINFVMLLCNLILNNDTNFISNFENSNCLIEVFLVLGLLTFAKKAPALIQELLPSSSTKAAGDFGLSFKKKTDNMLFGKPLGTAYDKAVGFLGKTAKGAALLPFSTAKLGAKKVITGLDYKKNGMGFMNGFNKVHGKAWQWVEKQREALTPETYKSKQEERQGREEVSKINQKYRDGVEVARKLKNAGAPNWKKALNGEAANEKYYREIFTSEEFINSKLAVDRTSKNAETMRYAQSALANGAKSVKIKLFKNDGSTEERVFDAAGLAEAIESEEKKLKGLEEVHESISKQHQGDAAIEKQFKFIKNNTSNPTNPTQDHHSDKIDDVDEITEDVPSVLEVDGDSEPEQQPNSQPTPSPVSSTTRTNSQPTRDPRIRTVDSQQPSAGTSSTSRSGSSQPGISGGTAETGYEDEFTRYYRDRDNNNDGSN